MPRFLDRDPVLPWRYLVPRWRYVEKLRIAQVAPEIRTHVDREARFVLVEMILLVPAVAVTLMALPFLAMGAIGVFLTGLVFSRDFAARKNANALSANGVIAPLEVRRRLEDAGHA